MTFAVDWMLKTNYLSIYHSLLPLSLYAPLFSLLFSPPLHLSSLSPWSNRCVCLIKNKKEPEIIDADD